MGKKLHKLDTGIKPEYILLGISSHEKDYRISWALNKELGMNFQREDDLIIENEKLSVKQSFSKYRCTGNDDNLYYLLANTGVEGYLAPELKNIDFFILTHDTEYINTADLTQQLREVSVISAVFEINLNTLKPATVKILTYFD